MARKLPTAVCYRDNCNDLSFFKRYCPVHYKQKFNNQPVYQYRFSWTVVQKFEGSIRAWSREEAQKLAEEGAIAGTLLNFMDKPIEVELLSEEQIEC